MGEEKKLTGVNQEYEKVIQYIYGRVQDGSLMIGSKLPTERAIAEELDIGRNSIREALSTLSGMGIIRRVQGSGNYISGDVGSAIQQIIQMMLALGSITKKDICEFRRVIDKSICGILLNKGLSEDYRDTIERILANMKVEQELPVEPDKSFHEILVRATENNIFITIMQSLTKIYREWIDRALVKTDARQKDMLYEVHFNMYKGLVDKNKDQVMNAIDRHYDFIDGLVEDN